MTHRTAVALALGLLLLAGCQYGGPRIHLPPDAELVAYRGGTVSNTAAVINPTWRTPTSGRLYFYNEDKDRVVAVVPVAAGEVPSIVIHESERVYFQPDATPTTTQPAR